jgi:hypothetical protein
MIDVSHPVRHDCTRQASSGTSPEGRVQNGFHGLNSGQVRRGPGPDTEVQAGLPPGTRGGEAGYRAVMELTLPSLLLTP